MFTVQQTRPASAGGNVLRPRWRTTAHNPNGYYPRIVNQDPMLAASGLAGSHRQPPLMMPSSTHSTPLRQREGSGYPLFVMEDAVAVRPRSAGFEERLKKAHDILRRKKRDFKEKQAHLEQLRADWKRDMAKAKSRRDVDTVQTLMDVLDVLEADARRINKEAISLKQSYAWLKKEEENMQQRPCPSARDWVSTTTLSSAATARVLFVPALNGGITSSSSSSTTVRPTHDAQTMMQRVDSVEAIHHVNTSRMFLCDTPATCDSTNKRSGDSKILHKSSTVSEVFCSSGK